MKTPGDLCQPCPKNVRCPQNSTIETMRLDVNYWRDSNRTATVYKCNYDVCTGGDSKILAANLDPYCKKDHGGPLCEECIAGKYFDDGKCSNCPSHKRFIVIGVIIVAISGVIIILFNTTNGKQHVDRMFQKFTSISLQAKMKIFISFYQVINTIETVYGVRIDKKMKAWFTFLSIFNFSFLNLLVPKQCFGSTRLQLIISSTWPFILLLLLIMGIMLHSVCIEKASGKHLKRIIFMKSLHMVILVVYVLLPSVSNAIFGAIRCKSYKSNDNDGLEISYLIEDGSIKCDEDDSDFQDLQSIFWVLFTLWPIMMPLFFSGLLYLIKKPVLLDCTTDLTEACRFLWRDYDKGMMTWEVLDVWRKVFLTGLILFIDTEQGSERMLRLIIASTISVAYLGLLALARPYKRNDDLYLSFASNILLSCCFLMGTVINVCDKGEDICHQLIGRLEPYHASVLAVVLTGGMLLISILLLSFVSQTTHPIPTILVNSTKSKPNLEMSDSCHFHIFLSHVWSTGQEKTQKIARMLQLHVPGIRVWLDVDQLDNIGEDALGKSVEDSEIFVLIYTSGYFKSENCCKEVRAAFNSNKPIFVLYEGGMKVIDTVKSECRFYFQSEADDVLNYIMRNEAILWLGSGAQPFAYKSVNLLVLRMLRHLPYYRRNYAQLDRGLRLGDKFDSSGFVYPEKIFFFEKNAGVDYLLDAFKEEHDNKISIIGDEEFFDRTSPVSLDDKVVIFNLRKNVLKDAQFVRIVERALEARMKFVLVHEQDSKESCEFEQITDETPNDLLARGIYNNIAVPFYAKEEYRVISMYILLKKISDVHSS